MGLEILNVTCTERTLCVQPFPVRFPDIPPLTRGGD